MNTRYFDKFRAVAVIGFFVDKWGGRANLYDLIKIIYNADKIHLNKTGYTITRDSYAAMPKGPTASGIYDLLQEAKGETTYRPWLHEFACNYLRVEHFDVSVRQPVPMEELSGKEIQTLNEVFSMLGHDREKSYRLAHDSAWKKSRTKEEHWMPYDDMVDDPELKRLIRESAEDSPAPTEIRINA